MPCQYWAVWAPVPLGYFSFSSLPSGPPVRRCSSFSRRQTRPELFLSPPPLLLLYPAKHWLVGDTDWFLHPLVSELPYLAPGTKPLFFSAFQLALDLLIRFVSRFPISSRTEAPSTILPLIVVLSAVALIREMEIPMNSATQPGAPFPVQHRAFSLDIKGNITDIVINKYEDTFMVIVTQIGCMGTILAAKKDESVFSDPTYNVSVLFGKRDEPLLLACARQLIEHISCYRKLHTIYDKRLHARPYVTYLVVLFGSSDNHLGTLKDIIAAIIENRLW
ncbi:hypothetical protein EJB05_22711, partial [Eragrostis curvula]